MVWGQIKGKIKMTTKSDFFKSVVVKTVAARDGFPFLKEDEKTFFDFCISFCRSSISNAAEHGRNFVTVDFVEGVWRANFPVTDDFDESICDFLNKEGFTAAVQDCGLIAIEWDIT